MTTPEHNQTVLCVLSNEQRLEYESELEQLHAAGVELTFQESPEQALEDLPALNPRLVMVGMEIGPMEGLEFVALLMNRYPDFEGKLLVLPNKGDPFPPVVQQRNAATGKSTTEQIDQAEMVAVVLAATAPPPAQAAEAPPTPPGPATPLPPEPTAPEQKPQEIPIAPPPVVAQPPAEPADLALAVTRAETQDPAPAQRPRPKWVLPAAGVAVVAAAAAAYLTLSGGKDEKSAPPETRTASQDERLAGTAAKATPGSARTESPDTSPSAATGADAGAPVGDTGSDSEPPTPPGKPLGKLAEHTTLPLGFPRGESRPELEDKEALKEVVAPFADALAEDAALWLEVGGHTSIDGAPEANHTLGRRRAEKVRRILEKLGVARARVVVKNYGAAMPVASNDTAEGREENRRVTIRLVE